jgi:YD repeat-containing protein
MRALAGLLVLCSLALALPCAAEDRTERIAGTKGWKELDYRDDRLVEERSFDESGVIVSERDFSPEALPIVTKSYLREAGRLVRIEASDASGAPIGRMVYQYDRNGRLLVAKSEGVFGDEAVGVVAVAGSPQGSWVESGPSATVLAYDDAGRAVLLQSMKDGKASKIERRTYGEKGLPSSIAIEDKAAGFTTETSYDAAGRASQKKVSNDKGEETLTRYRYDEAGHPIEESTRSGGHELLVKRSYSAEGKVARAETFRDGSMVLAVEYSEDSRIEELYEEGFLFVKATYKGGRKVKDEFYADGALARTREYQ